MGAPHEDSNEHEKKATLFAAALTPIIKSGRTTLIDEEGGPYLVITSDLIEQLQEKKIKADIFEDLDFIYVSRFRNGEWSGFDKLNESVNFHNLPSNGEVDCNENPSGKIMYTINLNDLSLKAGVDLSNKAPSPNASAGKNPISPVSVKSI